MHGSNEHLSNANVQSNVATARRSYPAKSRARLSAGLGGERVAAVTSGRAERPGPHAGRGRCPIGLRRRRAGWRRRKPPRPGRRTRVQDAGPRQRRPPVGCFRVQLLPGKVFVASRRPPTTEIVDPAVAGSSPVGHPAFASRSGSGVREWCGYGPPAGSSHWIVGGAAISRRSSSGALRSDPDAASRLTDALESVRAGSRVRWRLFRARERERERRPTPRRDENRARRVSRAS